MINRKIKTTRLTQTLAVCAIGAFASTSVHASLLSYNETFVGATVNQITLDVGSAVVNLGNGNAITAGQYYAPVNNTTFDGTAGTVQIAANGNYRALGTVISLDGIDAGTYTIDFLLSAYDYNPGTGPGYTAGGVWLVNGMTSGAGGGATQNFSAGSPVGGTPFKAPTADGTASITALNTAISLSGTGSNAGNFTLAAAGGADDYLFFQIARDGAGGTASGGLTLDTVSIEVIPEPAALGLVAVFGGAVIFIRRRLAI